MAAADEVLSPGVRYQVTDSLKERLPYKRESGFEVMRQKDAGKAQNGLLPQALDTLLLNLADTSMDQRQKAVAMKHLLGYCAYPEKKVVLLRKGIVKYVSAVMLASPLPILEHFGAEILRSLCFLPQGCHCVVVEGGLAVLVAAINNREQAAARLDARTAAVKAVLQLASHWDGRQWMLALDGALGMEFPDHSLPVPTEQEREVLSGDTCECLTGVFEHDSKNALMLRYAASAVAQLTVEPRGMQLCLIGGVLRGASKVLETFASSDQWVYGETAAEDAETVLHLATVVWHVGMDDTGKNEALELPIARQLTQLIAHVLPIADKYFPLKAALAGSACALALHPSFKALAITASAPSGAALLDSILSLLRQANSFYEPLFAARKAKQPAPFETPTFDDTQNAIKNCVQTVRLVCELPAGRDFVQAAVSGDAEYNLRRQLFYSTAFQEEFGVRPV